MATTIPCSSGELIEAVRSACAFWRRENGSFAPFTAALLAPVVARLWGGDCDRDEPTVPDAAVAQAERANAELARQAPALRLDGPAYLRLLRASGVLCGKDGCTNVGVMGLPHCFKHLTTDERAVALGAAKVLQLRIREEAAA